MDGDTEKVTIPQVITEETEDCEHDFENTYPMWECLICGLIEDAPEPIYEDDEWWK